MLLGKAPEYCQRSQLLPTQESASTIPLLDTAKIHALVTRLWG
jgi:hypothetical protein